MEWINTSIWQKLFTVVQRTPLRFQGIHELTEIVYKGLCVHVGLSMWYAFAQREDQWTSEKLKVKTENNVKSENQEVGR